MSNRNVLGAHESICILKILDIEKCKNQWTHANHLCENTDGGFIWKKYHIGTQDTQLFQVHAKTNNLKRTPSWLSMGNNQPIKMKNINHSSRRKGGSLRTYISQAPVQKIVQATSSKGCIYKHSTSKTFLAVIVSRIVNTRPSSVFSPFCTDTDECLTQCLDETQSCANTVGGFICIACQPGYKRNTSHPTECQGKPNWSTFL